jgi:hypothetical protein
MGNLETIKKGLTMEKITLQKFDDNFADFYDTEAGAFVLYAGTRGVRDCEIATEAKITDDDGATWDCYLLSVEYLPKLDMYEIKYKTY